MAGTWRRRWNILYRWRPKNVRLLADETIGMVRANALGIPLISLIQGCVALLGVLDIWYKGFCTAWPDYRHFCFLPGDRNGA